MTYEQFQKRYTYNQTTDHLGEGGFGKVFKAYDNHLDRWVAIKVAEIKTGLEQIRLKKEVELINKLPTNQNIARYEECYTFEFPVGTYDYGVLMYYEQGNLLQLIEREYLSFEQKQSILKQILAGIGFLHSQGIIHRDIKPQNILIVNRNGEYIPKITDFGISKQLDINKSSIFNNSLAGAGTLSYASPEQLGAKDIRKNTDLWSFGVIAFWMLTGKLPFNTGGHPATSEAGRAELFSQINTGKLPSDIQNIPHPWKTVIEKCLVLDYNTLRVQRVEDLENILQGKTISDPPPPKPPKADDTELNPKINDGDKTKPEIKKPEVPPIVNTDAPENKQKLLWWILGGAAVLLIVLLIWQPWGKTEVVNNDNKASNFEIVEEVEISLAEVQTDAISNITETTVTGGGNIIKDNGSPVTERGVVYSKSSNPTTSNTRVISGSGTGSFIVSLSSLQSNTKYYARAYAINEAGTAYGNEVSFTTKEKETQQTQNPSNSINISMVYVSGGTFTMGCTSEQGSDCSDDEKPAHSVTVSSFNIGKYEVTQAQWKAVMGASASLSNPSYFKGDNLPVEYVSWNDIQTFITKLNQMTGKRYRLPTEAEWEFAARGGVSATLNNRQSYKYAGSNSIGSVAWYTDNSGSKTHPVGQKSPNELGIYDMSGNVYEWCSDWYGDYSSGSQTNPKGATTGSNRVLRGGGWSDYAQFCRTAYRFDTPAICGNFIGFRLVSPQ